MSVDALQMLLRGTMVAEYVGLLLLVLTVSSSEAIENKASSNNDISQFVGQLTALLNQGILQQGVAPQEVVGYQAPGGRPYPYPPPGPYPYYPENYPNPNSLFGALSSISRYDDLRCVPRLLCEVASGARPGSYSQQQQSPVPFLSKDVLVTLLTVLNFVDDSPLLVFGRAALLGYTARGDSRACLAAYPTCPRDPDHLVDYLNNHNGGFFRFFNQQLPQYAPEFQQYHPMPHPQRPPYPPQYPTPYPPAQYPQQYSSQNQQYQGRIQNKPENILEYNYYSSLSTPRPTAEDVHGFASSSSLALRGQDYYNPTREFKTRVVFPQKENYIDSDISETVRGGKSIFFPQEHAKEDSFIGKPVPMVFPDRTGTGDLRLDLDDEGHYKTVHYESLLGKVAFPAQQTMHFPQ